MKRKILLFLLFSFVAVIFGNKSNAMAADCYIHKEYSIIEDSVKKNLTRLQHLLEESKFELPHHNGSGITRKNEQNNCRRTNENAHNEQTSDVQETGNRQKNGIITYHNAVATSRHTRGYYIYALRHIII